MKEILVPIDRDQLSYITKKAQCLLNDYIDQIPDFIIAGGIVVDGCDKGKDYGNPTVFKCQRNWLTGVFGLIDPILANAFFSPNLKQKARSFLEMILDRKKIPVEQKTHTAEKMSLDTGIG